MKRTLICIYALAAVAVSATAQPKLCLHCSGYAENSQLFSLTFSVKGAAIKNSLIASAC